MDIGIKDIVCFILFHAMLFLCWRKMILFLRKGKKQYWVMGWSFIGLYWLLFFLMFFVSGPDSSIKLLGIGIPMYVPFGLLMLYFPFRVIPSLKAATSKLIKGMIERKP